jgi:hypothetical protein
LQAALGYRKSYCRHISADIDYASHVADYLAEMPEADALKTKRASQLRGLMEALRGLEFEERRPTAGSAIKKCIRALWRALFASAALGGLFKERVLWACFSLHRDNRYEQHSWLWKTK